MNNTFIISISIIIVICVFFIIQMIDAELLEDNIKLSKIVKNNQQQEVLFYKTILYIKNQLKLTQLKECPEEELKEIPKEIIDFIDEIEKTKGMNNNAKIKDIH